MALYHLMSQHAELILPAGRIIAFAYDSNGTSPALLEFFPESLFSTQTNGTMGVANRVAGSARGVSGGSCLTALTVEAADCTRLLTPTA